MTIAQAFNEITIAHGGTPNDGGTITGAIDALNDTLAGSDQAQGRTIEDAVRLLGQHIGGSSVTVEPLTVTENGTYTAPEGKAYSTVTVEVEGMAYDMVIKLDSAQLNNVASATIESGSYSDIAAKVADGEPFNIMAYGAHGTGDKTYQSQFCVLGAYWDSYVEEGEDPYIHVALSDYNMTSESGYVSSTSGGSNTQKKNMAVLSTGDALIKTVYVHSDGTVTL